MLSWNALIGGKYHGTRMQRGDWPKELGHHIRDKETCAYSARQTNFLLPPTSNDVDRVHQGVEEPYVGTEELYTVLMNVMRCRIKQEEQTSRGEYP